MAKRNSKKNSRAVMIVTSLLTGVFLLFISCFVLHQCFLFFRDHEIFRIQEIVKDPSLPALDADFLERLKGQSIFSVNLQSLQKRLQARNPQVDQLKIQRKFPDRIAVVAKAREPFALVSGRNQEIVIAEDGFILDAHASPALKLPLIIGANLDRGLEAGRVLGGAEVLTGLDVIKKFSANRRLVSFELTSVDVGNVSKIICSLSGGLKIMVDQDRLNQKFQTLEYLLTEGNLKQEEIAYIDLRFREPILGKKPK